MKKHKYLTVYIKDIMGVNFLVSNIKFCGFDQSLSKLGEGGFGQVVECKASDPNAIPEFVIKHALDDNEVLDGEYKYLNHKSRADKFKYVARLYPVLTSQGKCCLQSKVVIERMNGDLHKIYHNALKNYSTNKDGYVRWSMHVISQLVEMLTYLHEQIKYCHNDIKPENIGYVYNKKLGEKPLLKFIDMGSSKAIEGVENIRMINIPTISPLNGFTLPYAAPFVITNQHHDLYRDQWAMGCTIYEIVAGTKMNHPINELEVRSIFVLLMSYSKAVLDYMLGDRDDYNDNIVSEKMVEARTKFVSNVPMYTFDVKGIIRTYMTPGLLSDDSCLFQSGGGVDFANMGVRTRVDKYGNVVVTDIADMSLYKTYVEQLQKSRCVTLGGDKQTTPSKRTKICESEYMRAKKSKAYRVAKYRLKNGGFVFYRYSKKN